MNSPEKTPVWEVTIHSRSLEDIKNHGNIIK